MRRLAFVTGLIGLLFLFLATDCPAAERLALLIGNQHYNKKVGELDNPLNDITLVGDALEKVGFKTARIKDADFDTLIKVVKAHIARVRQGWTWYNQLYLLFWARCFGCIKRIKLSNSCRRSKR